MLGLTQKGFSPAEVLALTEPEAASLVDILTDKPEKPEAARRYIPQRRKKKPK